MFNNIAPTYDRLNHTLSLGIDRRWRRAAIDALKPFAPQTILDIATGTGDFAILAARRLKPDSIIGVDISEADELVGIIDNYAVIRVFADGADVEDVLAAVDEGTFENEGDDLEIVWINNGRTDAANRATGLNAEDSGTDKTRVIH